MIDVRLKTRRRYRAIVATIVVMVAAIALADRAGAFGFRGDDWATFNQKRVRALDVVDGDTFRATLDDAGATVVVVRLLGVDAPDFPAGHWAAEAKRYTEARLANRSIVLRLDGTQTRDANGNLLAYVYILNSDCLNVDIVRDAQAFADRRIKHTLRSTVEQAENEARKKKRGMWKVLSDDQQPAWRQEWLRKPRTTRKN